MKREKRVNKTEIQEMRSLSKNQITPSEGVNLEQ